MNELLARLAARGFSALLRAAGLLALLACFVRPPQPVPRVRRRTAVLAGVFLALAALFALERAGGVTHYLFMLGTYGLCCLAAQLLVGGSWRFNAYRVLCFYLTADCADTLLRYAGMRLLEADYLRGGPWPLQLAAVAVWCACTLLPLLVVRRRLPAAPAQEPGAAALWAAVLAALPYLFVCQITVWLPLQNEQLNAGVPLVLLASCLLALLSMINFMGRLDAEILKRQALQRQHLMECRQQQFLLYKSSAEAVQRNYHDLKNILLYLENAADRTEVQAYVRRVMGQVRPYESLVETGNQTMDLLLSEKLALCQQEQVACTVDVEGALFDFISPYELCTLVGNALDNAIEACLKLPEPGARRILIKSARRGGFAVLCVRNSFDGQLPKGRRTLKPDVENHGYGLASIRQAAALYGGEVSCQQKDGEFILTLLFPLTQGQA